MRNIYFFAKKCKKRLDILEIKSYNTMYAKQGNSLEEHKNYQILKKCKKVKKSVDLRFKI